MRIGELCRDQKRNRQKRRCLGRPENSSPRTTLKNRQGSLRGAHGPATRIAHGRERVAMQRRGPVETQGFEMIRRRVALVAGGATTRRNRVPPLPSGRSGGFFS